MGTLIAWVLVRDRFPGQRIVDALIDLPFALPTIVAGLVLLSLYGTEQPGARQPRLHAGRRRRGAAVRDAAVRRADGAAGARSSSTATWSRRPPRSAPARSTTFRRIVLPNLLPAMLAGAGAGLHPGHRRVRRHRADLRQHPVQDAGRRRCTSSARSRATTRPARRPSRPCSWSSRSSCCSLTCCSAGRSPWLARDRERRAVARYVAAHHRAGLPAVPARAAGRPDLLAHLRERPRAGLRRAHHRRRRARLQGHRSSVAIVAVLANTIFGVGVALLLVRHGSRASASLNALIDLPLAVSPVVVGLALILVYGTLQHRSAAGWTGTGSTIIFCAARHGAGHHLRVAAAGGPRDRAGARGDRRRAGAGRVDARCQRAGRRSGGSRCPAIRWALGVRHRALPGPRARRVRRGRGRVRPPRRPDPDATLFVEERFQNFDQTAGVRRRHRCSRSSRGDRSSCW